uniref:Uncharacterized protein n=1 Tax=uncultured bacterium fosmid pJB16B1 TaxID=1478054 RepID=A0A0H3U9E8_9BACT|nr:hypothetical protein [uncultured bacterium fosmid pJB16B1]
MNANLINQIIRVNPERLDRPLPTMHARQHHSFTVYLVGLPTDVTSVVLRAFTPGGAGYVDIPVGLRPNLTSGIAYLIGTCFQTAGSAAYEIHAYDARGNSTSLGCGKVEIDAFTVSGSPIVPGAEVVLDRIKDASGNYHTIKAVPDGNGGYTTIIDDAN